MQSWRNQSDLTSCWYEHANRTGESYVIKPRWQAAQTEQEKNTASSIAAGPCGGR